MHRKRQYSTVAPTPSTSPPKLFVLAALLISFFLPYFLIKTYFGRETHHYTSKVATLIVPQQQEETTTSVKAAPEDEWVRLKTRPGDSFSIIFKRVGLSGKTLQAVMQHNRYAKLLTRIKPNQSLQLFIKQHQLERMIFQLNDDKILEMVRDKSSYHSTLHSQKMPIASPSAPSSPSASSPKPSKKTETRERYVTATVQYSLYSTAKRHNIPYTLIQQMTDIFKREINFAKDVRGGDRFTIIYKAGYKDSQLVDTGEIIAVTYTNRGVSHQALRHVNVDGDVEYFTPDGKSMRQGFSRYPVKFSHINSAFSLSRMHPILHYHRPHKGVDLAAPMGAPIRATGDGRVQELAYESGYGNVIKITHHNALYTSVYAHLSKFKKGLFRGSYVKRGEVIGYVGKSGLASGPHVHYEFHVNHHPRNPTTVPLPHAAPVPSRDMAAFKAHADKLIEHLRLFEKSHLSSTKNNSVG